MSKAPEEQIWIGLAEVHQRPGAGVLMDRNQAFVHVLALARTRSQFEQLVARAFAKLGFDVIDIEEPEPLQVRRARESVAEDLLELARAVESDGRPRYGAFYTWQSENDPD